MNATDLILTVQSEGVILSLSASGAIKYEGDEAAVDRWLPTIRGRKAEILEALTVASVDGAGADHDEAEAIAWLEDDRRRCAHCLNLRDGGFCAVAEPGGLPLTK